MSLAVWKTSLLPSVDDILLPLDKEEIMDPRRDGQIDKDVPLFRQAINLPEYGWLLDRFQFLPRMLGNWISPYYGTDILKINRDYNAIYPESAPVYDYACKVARLLLLEEIEDALLAQGKSPGTFFLQKKRKPIYEPPGTLSLKQQDALSRMESDALKHMKMSNGKFSVETLKAWTFFCGKKSVGIWYALSKENTEGIILPYTVWYSKNNMVDILETMVRDGIDLSVTIRNNFQIGTAFGVKSYYQKMHEEIQELLEKLSNSLPLVYDTFIDSYSDYVEDPTQTVVYNPYQEMDSQTLKDLKRLVFLVDTFNRPQNPQKTAPRIEAEWVEAINYNVMGTHLASKYLTKETLNFAEINGTRVYLLNPSILDADRVQKLTQTLRDLNANEAIQTLNSLENAIRNLPDKSAILAYLNILDALPSNLKNRVANGSNDVDAFLNSYTAGERELKNIQRKINNYFKKKNIDLGTIRMPDILPVPNVDLKRAQDALAFYKALETAGRNPITSSPTGFTDLNAFKTQIENVQKRRLNLGNTESQIYVEFNEAYNNWRKKAGKLLNMAPLVGNEFVDEYKQIVLAAATRLKDSANALAAENIILAEAEEQRLLEAQKRAEEERERQRLLNEERERQRLLDEQERKRLLDEQTERQKRDRIIEEQRSDINLQKLWDLLERPISSEIERKRLTQLSVDAFGDLSSYIKKRKAADQKFKNLFEANQEQWSKNKQFLAEDTIPIALAFDSTITYKMASNNDNILYLGNVSLAEQKIAAILLAFKLFAEFLISVNTNKQDDAREAFDKQFERLPNVLGPQIFKLEVSDNSDDFKVERNTNQIKIESEPKGRLVSRSYQKWDKNSCWQDSLFAVLFSIPETDLANTIYNTQTIQTPVINLSFFTKLKKTLSVIDRGCSVEEIAKLHNTLLFDIANTQQPLENRTESCTLIDAWHKSIACASRAPFYVDEYRMAQPDIVLTALSTIYPVEKDLLMLKNDEALILNTNKISLNSIVDTPSQIFINLHDYIGENIIIEGVEVISNPNNLPRDFDVPVETNNYVLSGVITLGGAHYVAYTFDFYAKEWTYFNNRTYEANPVGPELDKQIFSTLNAFKGRRLAYLVYTSQKQIDELVEKKKQTENVFAETIAELDGGNPNIGAFLQKIPSVEDQYTVILAAHRYGLIDLPEYASFIADALTPESINLNQIQRLMGVMSEDVIQKIRRYMEDTQ